MIKVRTEICLDQFAIAKDMLPWLLILIVFKSFFFVGNCYFDKVSDNICCHMLKDLGNRDRLQVLGSISFHILINGVCQSVEKTIEIKAK